MGYNRFKVPVDTSLRPRFRGKIELMNRKHGRKAGRASAGRLNQYLWGLLEMGVAFLLTLSVVLGPRVYAWIKGDAETKAKVDRFYQSLVTPPDPMSVKVRLPAAQSD